MKETKGANCLAAHHQNSTAPDTDVNLLPTQSLPRVFLENRLNLVPADTDIGWLVVGGGGGGSWNFVLVFPVCWQLLVLPELVDGCTNDNMLLQKVRKLLRDKRLHYVANWNPVITIITCRWLCIVLKFLCNSAAWSIGQVRQQAQSVGSSLHTFDAQLQLFTFTELQRNKFDSK